MPQDDAQLISQLNPTWPLITEKQLTWPGHFHAIKRAYKNTFPNVKGAVLPSQTNLNLLVGKTSLFNAIAGTPVRSTFFQVPITAGLIQSYAVPEAQVGDLVKAIPDNSGFDWQTLVIRAAWVTQVGRIALHFYKVGTQITAVEDTGYIEILLIRPNP